MKLDGVREPLIVSGIDTTNNIMVGLGACTIFEDNIAYLNSFRIRTEYRNKVNFGNGYKKIIEELEKEGIDTIITTITGRIIKWRKKYLLNKEEICNL